MRKIKVGGLVLDMSFYPRQEVNGQHVGDIVRALRAGAELPDLIVERDTNRVVDGFHRTQAYIKAFGADYKVRCIEKRYQSDRELFLDAIKYNNGHGRPLTTFDRARCAIMAQSLGIDDASVARALCVSEDYVGDIRVDRSAIGADGQTIVPIKKTLHPFRGQRLNERQERTNRGASGMHPLFHVNQLIALIESDLIDKTNEDLMAGLQRLAELLAGFVPTAA